MKEGRTLLLLGAGGFLGAHLRTSAAGLGLRVVAATRRESGAAPACDLLDRESLRDCVRAARPDLVVNAAGSASVGRSWENPEESFAINATGVLNLLEAVAAEAPAAHVLCLSSADVYGVRAQHELPLGEELETSPVTPYGTAKVAMEETCRRLARERGLRIGIAHLQPGRARPVAALRRPGLRPADRHGRAAGWGAGRAAPRQPRGGP
jgi:GDP-4-dehydro-6-deoxy-D-mannose reductase